jgi:uncharacterized protein (DUF697 family)
MDATAGAVSESESFEHASVLIYSLDGEADEHDLDCLRRAGRAHVPIICLRTDGGRSPLPHVLATSIVHLAQGEEPPVVKIGRLLVRLLDGRAVALAARVPALRPSVCGELIRRSARRSAFIGAATFVPAPDMPALFLEQARLVLRLGQAHARRLEPARAAELAAVMAAGLALRKLARRTRKVRRIPGWAVQGGVAYAGTLALGEAALVYFAAGGDDSEETLSEPAA